jgi:isopentenyl-diphosphate delta-isomerase
VGDVSADTRAARLTKDRHIEICLTQPVESRRANGFARWELLGDLPDFDFAATDLSTELFGRRLALPLYISSMTGGGDRSTELNRRLAGAARAGGIGMAVGSQSLLLKDPSTAASFQVRRWAPDVLLFADLGLVHLNYGLDRASCLRAVETIEADALMLYVNHMHEAFQVEGDLDFARLIYRLGELAADFPYPIVVKEVGNGFAEPTLSRLGQLPLSGVDVAGMGGTHWGRVEALVAGRELDSPLEELGVPTADALEAATRALPPTMPVFASGGVRTGVEVAKALALGARAVGMGLPFLKWAAESVDRVLAGVGELDRELRVSMWWAGARNVAALRGKVRRREAAATDAEDQ